MKLCIEMKCNQTSQCLSRDSQSDDLCQHTTSPLADCNLGRFSGELLLHFFPSVVYYQLALSKAAARGAGGRYKGVGKGQPGYLSGIP